MRYSEFIKGNDEFQYSINLQYDLNNLKKIKSYIPTKRSVELLNKYLMNITVKNSDKATVLIGPYGKGKSHLLLILLALMCEKSGSEEVKFLLEKIRKVDSGCADLAGEIVNNKKFLPLIINFNSEDLSQAFLVALNKALRSEGLDDIKPKTYFDSAMNIIESWKQHENKGMFNNFEGLIKGKTGLNIEDFTEKLREFDTNYYEIFKECFNEITFGVEFNPMINTDLVKLLEEVNHNLKENHGYDGTVIVFDEFSKFIESSETKNNAKDLKLLQDLAELCNRSNNPQMHLICISHKSINEYISKIQQDKIDDWRTIEGRFKEILFNSSSEQNYELISNAIYKEEKKLNDFIKENSEQLNNLTSEGERLFNYDSSEYYENVVKGCFPLSPYTTFALPILSEKVAQNERTLFTYLSKNEMNSVVEFIGENKGQLELVTLNRLYDYFEPLFKKETFNRKIYDIWLEVDTALKIVYSETEKKIIKALGVMYIVNDFEKLQPNEYNLRHALNLSNEELTATVKSLRDTNVLVLRKATNMLDFIPLSSIDVKGKVSNLAQTKFKDLNLSELFNEFTHLKYLLPRRYNDQYKMTRYFKRRFMTLDEMLAYSNAELLLEEYDCDGIIIDLIYSEDMPSGKVNEWLDLINDNRVVVVLPKKGVSAKLKNNLSQLKAIEHLLKDLEFLREDKGVESQLAIFHEDNMEIIQAYIDESYEILNGSCFKYIDKKLYKFISNYEISELLSVICEKNFASTPVVNNELINKNKVSTIVLKARDYIVQMLLEESYRNFDYSKNALECTLYRATIINQNLLETSGCNDNMSKFLNIIKEFFHRAEKKELLFSELYNELITNKNGIGVRKGIIPIYLAFLLKEYKDEVVVYLKSGRSKKEVILDNKLLNNINENPEKYLIKIDKGTKEKSDYIEELKNIFSDFYRNNTDNVYVNIVNSIRGWFNSLSIYAQNHMINIKGKAIDKGIVKLRRDIVKHDINYRSFVFDDLKKILSVNNYKDCISKMRDVKSYLEISEELLKKNVMSITKESINPEYEGSLGSSLKVWYDNLELDKKEHLYNRTTNEFLKLVSSLGNDDFENVNKLAVIFTGIMIGDWNDKTIDSYISELNECISLINSYEVDESIMDESMVKIIINSKDEEQLEKTFNKVEISDIGSTLLNSLEEDIDEYGDSISDEEKRNILMTILEKYI